MKFEILLNSILRLPLHKASALVKEYQKNTGFKNFYEKQRVLDILSHKVNVQKQIKKETFRKALIYLVFMTREKNECSKASFDNMKEFPMIIWIESIGQMDSESIMKLLNNYHKELTSSLVETCIINLSEDMQLKAIDRYKTDLDCKDNMFLNFYYSVCDEARIKLKEIFPESLEDDILLEMEDMNESQVLDILLNEKERLTKLPADDLIKFILLKATKIDTLNRFLEIYNNKVNKASISIFKLLVTRYKYLGSYSYSYNVDETKTLSDSKLFALFKTKFHEMGIKETLSLFDNHAHYKVNEFTANVVLEFLDIAYSDIDISKYINKKTIAEIINRFVKKCNEKLYSYEDFKLLVANIGKDGKNKLIYDDYIEAIIACGKLLRDREISDKDTVFLELRNKFTNDLIERSKKDGTYLENVSLNGVFYRLAKGSIPFDKVYMIETYKGLIYLSKSGQLIDNADYITNFLTDEQLVKLNISPVIKWKNAINRINTNADNLSFIERMGLQLLCYFGKDKGKYLLESNIQGNRMENLFDGLKYDTISINEDGTPNTNEELLNYLFGLGMMNEQNSVINRMLRGEIPKFEKKFTEFCNIFEEIKKECNGILSVKRIVKYFEDVDLPIELKPDEIKFKRALTEMNTLNPVLLSEAIGLCKDARNRWYLTIPKVEGQIGNFTYKVLDFGDSMAVAVGYLSHCCFVIRGISYSALKHSMQSKNGRTFVVYYKGQFLTQSWIWRNGDVICFDSVEAGNPYHGMYQDDIKLVDVYKIAAREMLNISQYTEDDIQKVKVVTIGKSDYTFNGLEEVTGDVPRPLESDLYVYDSNSQQILAGNMPKEPRYGVVGAKYRDPRNKVIFINDVNKADIDTLDEITLNINSLRYQLYREETPIDYTSYSKIITGDGWYILFNINGTIESGSLQGNEETQKEFDSYMSKYGHLDEEMFVKKMKLTNHKR